MVNKDLHNYL